jgi:hypothetical protein
MFAFEQSSTYRDPKNRFALNVPAGWKVRPLGDGVQVVRGDSYASVMVFEHVSDAASMIDGLQAQIGKKWQRFEVTAHSQSLLGGQKAASLSAAGVNPAGQEASLKLTGVISGDVALALITGFTKAEAKTAGTLAEIESSFQLLADRNPATAHSEPTLGIEVTEVSAEDARTYKLDEPKGVLVLRITEGGSAQKAGVKLYDLVIEADGQSIDSAATLQQIVRTHKVDDVLALQILRVGEDNRIQHAAVGVTLEPAPPPGR